jgi:hypothetical protein
MVPEQVWDWHLVHTGVCFLFFVCFPSSLVWFVLWLPEEVLTLLFLLHCENGDFSILMKDILCLFLFILFLESCHCFQKIWQKFGAADTCIHLPKILGACLYPSLHLYCWELTKSVVSHGSLSWLLMMKGVWHFVSDTHSWGYDHTHSCHVSFLVLLELTEQMQLKLWSFLCNSIVVL